MAEHLTVGRVAVPAGTGVRTPHHYDDIGLVRPCARTAAGGARVPAARHPKSAGPSATAISWISPRPNSLSGCSWPEAAVRERAGAGRITVPIGGPDDASTGTGVRAGGNSEYTVAGRDTWGFTGPLINSQSLSTNYTHPLYMVAPMV